MSIRISARGLVVQDDKVLLNEFNNGLSYNVPGGGIEYSETFEDCVKRELLEETGVAVNVDCFAFIYEYIPKLCNHLYGETHHISHVFLCSPIDSLETKMPTIPDIDEADSSLIHTGSKWVDIERIKEINLVPRINNTLYKLLKGEDIHTQIIREGYYID